MKKSRFPLVMSALHREQCARTALIMTAGLWRSGQQTDEQLRACVDEYRAAVAEHERLIGVDVGT